MTQGIFRKRIIQIVAAIVGIIVPVVIAHAQIAITEVAWMGTSNSQYEEWLELYNSGSEDVSLSGWKIVKTGGTVLFSPSGTIPSESYYLICRSTGTLTDPLGGTCNEKGTFGGSGLNNTNDQIIIKDSASEVKDSIDATGGWPGGDAVTKNTMQKSGAEWVTAAGTPGAATSSEDPDTNPDQKSEEEYGNNPEPTNPDPKPTTIKDPKEKVEKVEPDPVYKASMIIPDTGTTGVKVSMKALVLKNGKSELLRGRFEWSTGDGGSYKFLKNVPLEHTFYYPGNYTIVMQYYSDRFREMPDTIHRKTITIVPDNLQILGYTITDGLQIKNGADKDIPLDGWIIQSNNQEFIFPKYTTIAKGATLALSPKVLGIMLTKESINLLNPSKELVAKYSYHYEQPIGPIEESFSDEPDPQPIALSTQSPHQNSLPKVKSVVDIWSEYKWYLIFGGTVLMSILAYLGFHLYAKQDELI